MRQLVAVLMVLTVGPSAHADDPPDVRRTIERGLAFLAKDALAWKKQHNCISCHHAGLVVSALREGKSRGHVVDQAVLDEMTKWIAGGSDGSSARRFRTPEVPKAATLYPLLMGLGLAAANGPEAAARDKLQELLTVIKDDQTDDGSWQGWSGQGPRPPLFGSSQAMTSLAALALLHDAGAKGAVERGLKWLATTTPDGDAQADALRLVLWRRAGRPDQEAEAIVQRILGRQNKDGGWSQTKDMASDAFATGQALYALAEAGLKHDHRALQKAQAFLSATQRPDGSWPMTSRAGKPGDKGADNLIPITGAGSAWGTMGLIRSQGSGGRSQESGVKGQ